MKTCFVIIPFSKSFDGVCNAMRAAAIKCGLKYVRGDHNESPGSIMSQVRQEIRHAAVVVADISGNNPNVLYELGIAHEIRRPARVIIVTQKVDEKKVYDLHEFRQLQYKPSPTGLARLTEQMQVRLRKAMDANEDEEFWNVIRGRLPRTRIIVRDLQRLISNAGEKGLKDVTIRIAAGLSPLSISESEPPDPKLGREYLEALLAERNALRTALLHGAKLSVVLNPPRRFTQSMLPERLRIRYLRLVGLLEGRSDIQHHPRITAQDVKAMKQCRFALSPVPMPNVFIIGRIIAFEGIKRAGTGGFEMTHCETNPEALREMIDQFDAFFEESYQETLRAHPTQESLARQLRSFYNEAVALETVRVKTRRIAT